MQSRQTNMLLLGIKQAGIPSNRVDHKTATHRMASDRVLAGMGEKSRVFDGSVNAATGLRWSI